MKKLIGESSYNRKNDIICLMNQYIELGIPNMLQSNIVLYGEEYNDMNALLLSMVNIKQDGRPDMELVYQLLQNALKPILHNFG